jgi:hypothetical protein
LIELEERRVGSDLWHRSSSLRGILIGSHSPPSGCLLQSFNTLLEEKCMGFIREEYISFATMFSIYNAPLELPLIPNIFPDPRSQEAKV